MAIENEKAYFAQLGTKAKMLTPEEVVSCIEHAVGGVCPFATKPGVSVYLDISMQRFPHCISRLRQQ